MLRAGTRLGPYEVTAQIGVGGMGEVYRATDSNLKRSVAIKVLPPAVAGDADRLARFQREAEMLAALNHPNIAAIYGLEKTPDFTALVMELVEGDDLSQRIARGAIPIDEALPIAKQIADALEAAHEQNIMHRDLKPANIKVRADGTVKVLDFGLAKAMDVGSGGTGGLSMSPTLTTPAMTQAGMILGTAAYMSPEQARGKTVDKRADIWAFGAVLFEMLTGRRAFEDEDVSMTLSKVLQREPDFDAVPSTVPARVGHVLRVCLRKDPKQRVGDIRDVRLALEGAFETIVPATPSSAPTSAPRGRLAWAAFALAAVMTLALIAMYIARTPVPETVIRFSVAAPADTRFAGVATGTVSPNGRRLVFAATDGSGKTLLWVRELDQLEARALNGTDGAVYPFWSPDSRVIGFFAQAKLKKIEGSGGPTQTLCDAPSARGGTWNNEGVIVFAPTSGSGLQRVSAEGGEPVDATPFDKSRNETSHRWPFFLPDGRHFLYRVEGGKPPGIYIGSLDSKTATYLGAADSNAVFAAPSHVLFVRATTLMARPFDAKRLQWSGEAFPIVERVSNGAGALGAFSASTNGVLSYWAGVSGDTQLAWSDRSGKPLQTVSPPGRYGQPTLSPDETKVAFSRDGDIWVQDLARGTVTRITSDPAPDGSPVWSPDAKFIVFEAERAPVGVYRKLSTGTGQEELLQKGAVLPTDWSSDGRFITYFTSASPDIFVLPTSGDAKPQTYLATQFTEGENRFSPDTRFLAYTADDSGRLEVYVQRFPISGERWQISTNSGRQPFWRRDGRELFYLTLEGDIMAVDIKTGPAFQVGTPRLLFRARVSTGNVRNSYYPTGDGQRFLLNQFGDSGLFQPISVTVNWMAALNKR
jgi:Tol biopolymer transport system component